ncbi:MAG: DUF2950 family protein [Nitrospiraceae bacterium]|nr:MAG: DUF2950 family protein [Nitrospiraceae bacterium]
MMTFIVNYDVTVDQKELGEDTGQPARALETYDPDMTRVPVTTDRKGE